MRAEEEEKAREQAAKDRKNIAEEAKLQADEKKEVILEDTENSEIYEAAAEFKADNENQAENHDNFDAIKKLIDEGRKSIVNEIHIALASNRRERQKENAQLEDNIVQRIGEMFNDTETGKSRRRAADLEIEKRQLKAQIAELEAQLFREKEEESNTKAPSTPILPSRNQVNLPPGAAAGSFRSVGGPRREQEE